MTGTPTLREILDFDPARFAEGGRGWLADAKTYDACATAIQAVHARHLEDTDGTAETTRADFLVPHRQDFDAYSDSLAEAGKHAIAGGDELGHIQSLVRALFDQHGESGQLELLESGKVVGPIWDYKAAWAIADALWAYRQQFGDAAQQIHGRIDAALAKYDNVNGKQPKNMRFFGGPGGIGGGMKDEGPGTDPDANAEAMRIATGSEEVPKDPKRLHDLWSKWDDKEKAAVAAKHPDIGNYGGIPYPDRDHYNRENLGKLRSDVRAQLDALNRHLPDWGPDNLPQGDWATQDWQKQHDYWQKKLDEYNQLQATIDQSGPHRFLGFVDDKGHTSVSVGNPDTAKNVDTFVPGTGQDLSRIKFSDDHALAMYNEAHNQSKSSEYDPNLVSVTTWMGYDRPMNIPDAGSESYARNGAQALDDWQNGIRASHEDDKYGRAYQTVIGHSYGSSVVGAAATEGHHLDADAVISVGSPGMFANSAHEMDLNPNARVFNALADNDILNLASDHFGQTPILWTDATQFATDPGEPGPVYGYSVDAHSSYFNPDSTGLKNIAKIIDGQEPEHKP